MELRQLRYFTAVAELKNFTRAAEKCGVAQPSLSQQVRNLEEEFGERLLHRHSRKVELTEAGRMALGHARQLLEEAQRLQDAFNRRKDSLDGSVELGVIPTIAPFLLPPVVAPFERNHPNVSILVRETTTSELIHMVVDGAVDLAIVSDIGSVEKKKWSLHVKELFRESLFIAVPESHRLALDEKPLSIADIPRDRLIVLSDGHCFGDQVLKLCRSSRKGSHLECGQLETLLAMVASNLGVGIVPEMSIRERRIKGVVFRRLGSPEPTRVISVMRSRHHGLSLPAATFLEYLRRP